VHRDIKPANILVTPEGRPKLLDFGIAKILDSEGRSSGGTETLYPVMTPDYASPEQIRGAPITTATDVYSLGVVLYELLTGRRPYVLASGRTDELIRVVCNTDPPRPSAAVLRERPNVEDGEAAGSPPGGETAASLARKLRGDLDAIAAKAMRKEPEHRYASVDQLAADVRRYRQGRPVLARRGTVSYRVGKFARRHRIGLAAAAAVVLALAAATGATLQGARRARLAEARAQRRFDDVRRLANSLLFEFDDSIRDLPGSTPARAMLVARALEYLDGLSRESAGDRGLRRELADAYQKVADVQGNPFHANLGEMKGGLESYGKAIALLEPAVSGGIGTVDERSSLASAYLGRSGLELSSGRAAAAVADSRRGVALREALAREAPRDGARQMDLAQALQFFAFHLQSAGELDQAEAALLRQEAILRERARAEPASRIVRRALEQNRYVIASTLEHRGRIDEALAGYRESAKGAAALRAEDPSNAMYVRDLGYAETQIGNLEARRGNAADALDSHRAALAAFSELAAADAKSVDARLGVAMSHHNSAEVLTELGRGDEAAAERRLARPDYESVVSAAPSNLWASAMLADLYVELAAAEPAGSAASCTLARRSVDLFERVSAAGALTEQRRASFADARTLAARCASPATASAAAAPH
ncbi:MAG TPA: serine/threonine-protein kinase, partial [Thermoanaerobaculia bacterium]|nr:serine/threonine-protein kinase [Thermoanaerobaculia bacterium]